MMSVFMCCMLHSIALTSVHLSQPLSKFRELVCMRCKEYCSQAVSLTWADVRFFQSGYVAHALLLALPLCFTCFVSQMHLQISKASLLAFSQVSPVLFQRQSFASTPGLKSVTNESCKWKQIFIRTCMDARTHVLQ